MAQIKPLRNSTSDVKILNLKHIVVISFLVVFGSHSAYCHIHCAPWMCFRFALYSTSALPS